MRKFILLFFLLSLSSSLLVSQNRNYSTSSKDQFERVTVAVIDTLHYMDGTGALYLSNNSGYVAGTNGYGDLGKYQRFDIAQSYFLNGYVALFGEKGVVGTADNIDFVVKAVDTVGAPGATLHTQTVTTNSLDTTGWTSFIVSPPLLVSAPFFIGFEWTAAVDDSFGLVSDADGAGNNAFRAWEKFSDGSFFAMNSTSSWQLDIDLWIGAILDDVIPVELTSFAANIKDGQVRLNWATATETNNKGFEVQRKSEGSDFIQVGFIGGKGTTAEAQSYSFIDKDLSVGNYTYRLKQIDFDGKFEYSNLVEAEIIAPSVFELKQNYPNPFNPATSINFSLAVDSKVSLKIYNVVGEEIAEILNSQIAAGSHAVNFNASSFGGLNSGVYFYRINASGIDGTNFSSVKKMMMTK